MNSRAAPPAPPRCIMRAHALTRKPRTQADIQPTPTPIKHNKTRKKKHPTEGMLKTTSRTKTLTKKYVIILQYNIFGSH